MSDRDMSESGIISRVSERFLRGGQLRMRPHPGPTADADNEGATPGRSGALRAAVFGINDGLVSNLSLIMGVAGAAVANRVILLAGLSGLLAGAFSMAAGEYVSMRTQRELFERLLHLEAHELFQEPEMEFEELTQIYQRKGFPRELAAKVTEVIHADPELALETHAKEELGLDPDELGSPWSAALSSFVMFGIGAAIPLVPFAVSSGLAATLGAICAGGVALFTVGALMARITGRRFWWSGIRMLLIGAAAAAVTFGVGRLLHVGGAVG